MTNIKTEFIQLIKFQDVIRDKVKQLNKLMPRSPSETQVIDSQGYAYRVILWEITQFLLDGAEDERERQREVYYDLMDD